MQVGPRDEREGFGERGADEDQDEPIAQEMPVLPACSVRSMPVVMLLRSQPSRCAAVLLALVLAPERTCLSALALSRERASSSSVRCVTGATVPGPPPTHRAGSRRAPCVLSDRWSLSGLQRSTSRLNTRALPTGRTPLPHHTGRDVGGWVMPMLWHVGACTGGVVLHCVRRAW